MDSPNTNNPQATDSRLHFLDYWRIIRIRKTVIFAVFLLVVLTTSIVTYWLPKYYASTVRVAIEKDMPDISPLFDYRQTTPVFDPFFITTEFEKIQSKTVLYSVITNRDLNLNSKWAARFHVPLLKTPETYSILKKRIDVRQFRNTSLIEIRVMSEDKEEAAAIANKIAEAYKDWRLSQRMTAALKGIKSLQDQFEEYEKRVEKMQQDVAMMRSTNSISDAVADNAQVMALEPETVRRLESARVDSLANYSQIKGQLDNLQSLERSSLRKALPTASADAQLSELLSKYASAEQELASLKKDYTEEHPTVARVKSILSQVDTQIEAKMDGIMLGLKSRLDGLKNELEARTMELEKAKTKDRESAQTYGPYILAKRELESLKKVRDTMQLRIIQETVDAKLTKSQIVDVIDQAEPGVNPVRPNVPLNIALGIIVGLAVGIGLAFFIEYLDTSVKTIDDVERALQAAVVGVIPQNVGFLLQEGPDSPHAEAYRVLRTNLLFSRKDERFNTLTVVSGGAGEGKSTTVFNLATVFAQNGQRVLLVDSDLRRPSLHRFLNISNSIGLTNYLLKQKTLEEVVQTTPLATLDFLPSGKLPSSSLGILNSTRMKEFIQEVRKRYDFVLFDSPPIMGVSDASVLASEVDMALLVVQYRKYPQIMTLRAKQMVQKVGGNLLGVVLNNINISQDSYYYYYSGYYYDYYSYGSKKGEDSEGKAEEDGRKPGEKKDSTESAKMDLKKKY